MIVLLSSFGILLDKVSSFVGSLALIKIVGCFFGVPSVSFDVLSDLLVAKLLPNPLESYETN